MQRKSNQHIHSMEDLKKEQQAVRLRIGEQETALKNKLNQVPGELFYSGMDSMIPSFLSGRVSSFALNAGKGLINQFFVRKAISSGGSKLLNIVKPSGILRKARLVLKAIVRRKG